MNNFEKLHPRSENRQKNKKGKRDFSSSVVSNEDEKGFPTTLKVTSDVDKKLVKSVGHSNTSNVILTLDEASPINESLSTSPNKHHGSFSCPEKALTSKPKDLETEEGKLSSVSTRLGDLHIEEVIPTSDGRTVDSVKNVPPTGKLSDMGLAKIFTALIDVGTEVMQAVFQTIFFAEELKSQEAGTVVNLQAWFKKYEYSNKTIKDKLGGGYHKDTSNPLIKKYDIQFYMFAFGLYNKKYKPIMDDLIPDLEKLKNMRDKICHRGLFYTSVNATLNTLGKAYVSCLKNVARHFDDKTYTAPILKNVPKKMAFIKKHDPDLTKFWKDYEMFLNQPRQKFIHEAQKKLITTMKRSFTNPFYWIQDDDTEHFKFALSDVYCDPWIKWRNDPVYVPQLFVIPERGVPPQVLILEGDGATGKTTLCHKIFSQWQNKGTTEPTFLTLKSFDLILLLELRNINETSLVEYLKNTLLPAIEMTIQPNVLLELIQDLDVLFIIDGFDEQDSNGWNVKLVKDIAKNLYPKNRVLLTTRSEYRREADKLFSSVKIERLDLCGLDDTAQMELSVKLIQVLSKENDSTDLHEQFSHFLKERGSIFNDRLRIPLVMNLLVLLWLQFKDDDPDILKEIKSTTQLYKHLIEMLKGKLAERLERAADRALNSGDTSARPAYRDELDILNSLDEMLIILSEAAYSQTRASTVDLKLNPSNLSSLRESCQLKEINFVQFLSAFLIHNVRDGAPQYYFFHRTEADYLSAAFIAENVKVNKCTNLSQCFQEGTEMKKYRETMLFLVGCLSIKNMLKKFEREIMQMITHAGVDCYDFNFLFKLLVESGSGEKHSSDVNNCKEILCSEVASYVSRQLWTLKEDTVIAGLRILTHCFHVEIDILEIDFAPQVDPDNSDLTRLVDVMEKLKWALKRRFCKEKMTEIELSLHIRFHALEYDSATSDQYLSCLHPWAKLVKFTGHIGKDASDHLFYCTNLKDLDIKISSVETYNQFVKICFPRYSRLKKLILRMYFPLVQDLPLLPLPSQGPRSVRTAVRLHFKEVVKKSLDQTINIILGISGEQVGALERVVISSFDLDLSSAECLFRRLQDVVCEKVSVSSHTELRPNQLDNIRGKRSSFIYEWNDRNISEALWAGPNPTVRYHGPICPR